MTKMKYIKKLIGISVITALSASVCIAATYTLKQSGSKTTIKSATPSAANVYNTYNSTQYVNNNTVNQNAAPVIDIVMDFSGSMSDVVDVAKRTMSSVVSQIPSSTKIGFRVFGQGGASSNIKMGQVQSVQKTVNKNGQTVYKLQTGKHESNGGSCKATQLVTPISSANANALINGMNSVSLGGSTPMVYALEQAAYTDLGNISRDIPKKIILITDGGENCGGDPCAFAKTLVNVRRDITVDVVLVATNSKRLQCLANTTGGNVYNLSNVNQFANIMKQSIQTPANTTPVNNYDNTPQQQYEFINE